MVMATLSYGLVHRLFESEKYTGLNGETFDISLFSNTVGPFKKTRGRIRCICEISFLRERSEGKFAIDKVSWSFSFSF